MTGKFLLLLYRQNRAITLVRRDFNDDPTRTCHIIFCRADCERTIIIILSVQQRFSIRLHAQSLRQLLLMDNRNRITLILLYGIHRTSEDII